MLEVRVIDRAVLRNECDAFARYLVYQRPNEYVLSKYEYAHESGNLLDDPGSESFDAMLIRMARIHPLMTRLVDVYTSLYFRNAIARRKFVLLLAILESCAPTHVYLDTPDQCSAPVLYLRMCRKAVGFVVAMTAATALLPLHWCFSLGSRLRSLSYQWKTF